MTQGGRPRWRCPGWPSPAVAPDTHKRADPGSRRSVRALTGVRSELGSRAVSVGTMLVAFSISPVTGDDAGGVGAAVAAAVRVVRESGLPCETNAMFTNVEGEWDEVMAVIKRAVDVVAATSPRVGLVLKADIRPGRSDQLTAKVASIEHRLADQ